MKVLAVLGHYPPEKRVGAWLATHLFMRHLVALGHEVTATPYKSTARKGWEIDGVTVRPTPTMTETHKLAAGVDVVVSHFGDGSRGAKVARNVGVPSVQIGHGRINKAPASADLVVFVSAASQARCRGVARSVVCHPPTDPAEHRVQVTGDMVTIVNLSKKKGIITAWRCADRQPDRRFLGVEGAYGEQIRPRTGSWDVLPVQSDMRAVWARTRVLLMPSEVESWGMVGVEAMCSGIPVIAHPTPGLQESLGGAGIFVDRDDIDGWCDALDRLDDPDEYARASAAALTRAGELDPAPSLARFAEAVESLVEVNDGPTAR